jgi:hypothetical protein
MTRLQRISPVNGRFLTRRWKHFKLRRLPRLHFFHVRCVNAEHDVNANILPVGREFDDHRIVAQVQYGSLIQRVIVGTRN